MICMLRPHIPKRIDLDSVFAVETRDDKDKKKPKSRKKSIKKEATIAPANVEPGKPESYIILPAGNYGSREYPELYIGINRISYSDTRVQKAVQELYAQEKFSDNDLGFLGNINHSQALKITKRIGGFTLPVLLGREFLRHLKSGIEGRVEVLNGARQKMDNPVLEGVYNDIVEVREPWRAEWFIDRFKKKGSKMQVTTYVFDKGELKELTENLQNYLKSDKTPGISMNEWMSKSTNQGLPLPNCSDGDLWYWSPASGYVARFNADSGRTLLNCGRDPTNSNSSLGVREARAKI